MTGEKLQSWLTPALLAAGLVVLVHISSQQTALEEKVDDALKELVRHETILRVNGLYEPKKLNGVNRLID